MFQLKVTYRNAMENIHTRTVPVIWRELTIATQALTRLSQHYEVAHGYFSSLPKDHPRPEAYQNKPWLAATDPLSPHTEDAWTRQLRLPVEASEGGEVVDAPWCGYQTTLLQAVIELVPTKAICYTPEK
jgi:hypothetical protein